MIAIELHAMHACMGSDAMAISTIEYLSLLGRALYRDSQFSQGYTAVRWPIEHVHPRLK